MAEVHASAIEVDDDILVVQASEQRTVLQYIRPWESILDIGSVFHGRAHSSF